MSKSFLDFQLIQISNNEAILNKCIGSADKGIFICYQESDTAMEEFLSKILSAVKLDLKNDVLVFKKTREDAFSFSRLNDKQKLKNALLFGISPQTIGLQVNCQKYQPFTIGNCQFLFADTLTEINSQQGLKKALWASLQKIFN